MVGGEGRAGAGYGGKRPRVKVAGEAGEVRVHVVGILGLDVVNERLGSGKEGMQR